MEGELLGYRWVTQEAQSQRMDGVLHGLAEAPNQTEDLNSVTERGDNLLDWTVRDQAETSIDYDLGEIANRSFQDKYGIWAGQEEIFPDWETKESEDSERTGGLKPGDSKQSEEVQSNSEIENRVGRVAPWASECYNRATKERVEMVEIHHPSPDSGSPEGIAPWAASAYLRAMAEEKSRVCPWEEEVEMLRDADWEELDVGSIAWEGSPEEGPD